MPIIYSFLIFGLSIVYFLEHKLYLNRRAVSIISIFVYAVFSIIFFSLRSEEVGSDTDVYIDFFRQASNYTLTEVLEVFRFEIGFTTYSYLLSLIFSGVEVKFLISLTQIYLSIYFFYKFTSGKATLFLVLVYMGFFVNINLNVNVIRQGMAICFIMLFYKSILENKIITSLAFILIAISFHKTSVLCCVAYLVHYTKINKYIGWLILAWLAISIISYLELPETFIRRLLIDAGILGDYSHISNSTGYVTGFRFDFWSISFLPILVYILAPLFKLRKTPSLEFFITNYLILNSVFILMFFMPYSDRVGTYSWYLIPIISLLMFAKSQDKNGAYILSDSNLGIAYMYLLVISIGGVMAYVYMPPMQIGY